MIHALPGVHFEVVDLVAGFVDVYSFIDISVRGLDGANVCRQMILIDHRLIVGIAPVVDDSFKRHNVFSILRKPVATPAKFISTRMAETAKT